MTWLAFDIGGVNFKVADGLGFAVSQSFYLWEKLNQLVDALRALIAGAPPPDHLVATMTGELADCFASRTEGVKFILAALDKASDYRYTRVYLLNGSLVLIPVVLKILLLAAVSNWHALACFVG